MNPRGALCTATAGGGLESRRQSGESLRSMSSAPKPARRRVILLIAAQQFRQLTHFEQLPHFRIILIACAIDNCTSCRSGLAWWFLERGCLKNGGPITYATAQCMPGLYRTQTSSGMSRMSKCFLRPPGATRVIICEARRAL